MSCISGIKDYIADRTFACHDRYDMFSIPEEPNHYTFNCLEEMGNQMLVPMEWVFEELDSTNDCLYESVLVVIGVFAAMIGLVGVLFKAIGEAVNPNSTLRTQAYEKHQAYKDILSRNRTRLEGSNIGIFTGIANYTGVVTGSMTTARLFAQNIVNKAIDPVQKEALNAKWKELDNRLANKIRSSGDISAEAQELLELVQADPKTSQAVQSYIDAIKTAEANKKLCLELEAERRAAAAAYEAVIAKMRPAAVVPV